MVAWRHGLSPHALSKRSEFARIGLFLPPPRNLEVEAFLAGLRDLGWVEGDNVHVEYRDAGGDDSRLPALAAELVALDVDVLATATVYGILAAHRATTKIPTVMIVGPDLVTLGLAASMAHPGGNITGQTFFLGELAAKRLEILAALSLDDPLRGAIATRESPEHHYNGRHDDRGADIEGGAATD